VVVVWSLLKLKYLKLSRFSHLKDTALTENANMFVWLTDKAKSEK
jgi:hypothetical protein